MSLTMPPRPAGPCRRRRRRRRRRPADELSRRYIAARGARRSWPPSPASASCARTGPSAPNPGDDHEEACGPLSHRPGTAGRPTVARGLDPAGAWESVNGKVTRRPADQELELRELDGDFDGFLVDYKAKGHAVEYVGREKAGGIDTYKLKVTLKSGAVRHVYLDADDVPRAQAGGHDDAARWEGAGDPHLRRLARRGGREVSLRDRRRARVVSSADLCDLHRTHRAEPAWSTTRCSRCR